MPPTIATMFTNLGSSFPGLYRLTYVGFWVAGLCCVVWGVNNLRQVTNDQYRSGGSSAATGSLISILIGTVLLYLPTLLASVAATVFDTHAAPTGLTDYATPDQSGAGTYVALRTFIQLVGVYFFGRGWLSLRSVGINGESQSHTFYGGVVRIFAGIMLVHIVDSLKILAATFGLSAVTALMQEFGG